MAGVPTQKSRDGGRPRVAKAKSGAKSGSARKARPKSHEKWPPKRDAKRSANRGVKGEASQSASTHEKRPAKGDAKHSASTHEKRPAKSDAKHSVNLQEKRGPRGEGRRHSPSAHARQPTTLETDDSVREGEKAKAPNRAPQRPPRPSPDARAKIAAQLAELNGEAEPLGPSRSGTVALVGRPNVGKSTLLNAALEQPLAIVTSTPQTTRDTILGVVHVGQSEIALLDTPGLHKARSALSRAMNRSARNAAKAADVVVFVTDIPILTGSERGPLRPMPGDLLLLKDIGEGQPTVLVINKVDRARDKAVLLPLIEELSRSRKFEAIVPISAKRENGVLRVLAEVSKLLPEGEHRYGEDDITDRPSRFFAAEYVREQVLLATKEEVPHATAVTIEAFEEKPKVMRISATIHVERPGQKKILVGAGGLMLREIGTKARARIEALLECPVYLELFVRVTEGWRESPQLLEELGYGGSAEDAPRADLAGELEEPS